MDDMENIALLSSIMGDPSIDDDLPFAMRMKDSASAKLEKVLGWAEATHETLVRMAIKGRRAAFRSIENLRETEMGEEALHFAEHPRRYIRRVFDEAYAKRHPVPYALQCKFLARARLAGGVAVGGGLASAFVGFAEAAGVILAVSAATGAIWSGVKVYGIYTRAGFPQNRR